MASLLQVQVSQQNDTVLIKFIGEARLDVEDIAFQLDRVVVHHPRIIIVDATELSFLSSIGMSLLVNLRRSAMKCGGVVKIAGLQPLIRDALAHARLLEMFELYPDVAAIYGQPAHIPSPASAPAAG